MTIALAVCEDAEDDHQAPYPQQNSSDATTSDTGGDCDIHHIQQLDPLLLAWHQAINVGRTIRAAECFALLDLQQRYGAAALRRWMFRATNAGASLVLPSYYAACAATESFDGYSRAGRSPVTAETVAPVPAAPARAARPKPPRALDAAQAARVAALEQRVGQRIRRPDLLADAPQELLERWLAIAGHPGLLATKLQIGWLISAIGHGEPPPSVAALDRWADANGIAYYDPRMIAFRTAYAGAMQPAVSAPADTADPPVAASAEPPTVPTERSDDVVRWDACMHELRASSDRAAFRRWLEPLRLVSLSAAGITLSVPSAAHKATIEAHYLALLRSCLATYAGHALPIRLVIAAPAPCAPAPSWIAAADWHALAPALQHALRGSRLDADGGVQVRADADDQVLARYAAPLLAVISRAQARPPTPG